MQNQEMKQDSNVAFLCGRILNRFEKPGVAIITLSIPEMVKEEKQINYPKIYFFQEDRTKVNRFLVGDEVFVQAHIAAPEKKRYDGTKYISQALVGDEIRERRALYADSGFAADLPRGLSEPYTNFLALHGPVADVRQIGEHLVGVKIDVTDHGHAYAVELTTRKKDALLLAPGTVVTAYGKARTRRHEREGKRPVEFQDFLLLSWKEEENPKKGEESDGDEKEVE